MASSEEPDVSDYQAPITCLDCEGHKNVNSYCVDCKGNICDKCKTRRLHKHHKIFPRTHREAVKARRKAKQRCKKHSDREYVTFCKKCSQPCCSDCIAKEHALHAPFINIDDAAKDAMTYIQSYMATLERDVLPSIENLHGDLEEGIEKYNKSLQKTKKDSKHRFQTLRDELDQAERNWMQQLNNIEQSDQSEMTQLKHEVEEMISKVRDLVTACKTAVTESRELDMLLLKPKCQDISYLEPSNVSLPALVHFLPSTFQFPKLNDIVGRIEREETKISVQKSPARSFSEDDKRPFIASMVATTPVKTYDVRGDNILHTNEGVWINNVHTAEQTLYNENGDRIKTFHLGLIIRDMAMASINNVIATDCENKCLVRISHSDGITTLCSTAELEPWGLCINDKQQIVVGLRRGYAKQPIKLAVYSPDGSLLLQEMEKDKSRKPLFTKAIYQVTQNGHRDYVVADHNRIVCVSRVGEYRWEYQVKQSGEYTPVVYGMVCDRYDNIIVAERWNDKISLLDSEGKLITTLMTGVDGVSSPYSLAIDRQGHMWIGQSDNVKVVKYIK